MESLILHSPSLSLSSSSFRRPNLRPLAATSTLLNPNCPKSLSTLQPYTTTHSSDTLLNPNKSHSTLFNTIKKPKCPKTLSTLHASRTGQCPDSLLNNKKSQSSLFNNIKNPKFAKSLSTLEKARKSLIIVHSTSIASSVAESEPTQQPIQGAKPIPLIISIAIGVIVRFLVPKPPEVTPQAWQLLSIFLSTIAGLVLGPLPVGAWAFLGLTASIISRTLTFTTAFSAFTNEVIWLIVISFFFARGFVKTGLGDRIATYFVKWLGKSTLGLSYGLTLSEALIAPAMPSTTARAGGVFLPIIKSLSLSAGSNPNDPSAKKLGAYLIQSQFQCAGNSSALFLTAAAQNLLCLKLAEALGVVVANPWVSWFKAASLPALVSLLATPLILYKLYPPETKDTPEAPAMAAKKLDLMGPVTKNEWVMIATMLLAVSLWVCGDAIGIPSVVAAMLGLSILLLLGVLDWDDCLSEKSAWDTLAWFAVLVGMAGQLTNLGIVTWMSNCVAKFLQSLSLSWPAAFGVLQAAYFFIHYLFASQTGHVGALYSAFLAMNLASGVPGILAALALAYNTNLFGALTHYSSGQAAVYFGAGYVDLPDIFKFGFIMALVNAIIWGVVGTFWWKFLGLY
ncbi:primary active transporter [Lithospermum erythrorhizon]|uniref:Primary active transporter n=1 Tax=Lithospermum erythrorhizon TaxID=34254 RepID=A0AAV3PLM7_LITER